MKEVLDIVLVGDIESWAIVVPVAKLTYNGVELVAYHLNGGFRLSTVYGRLDNWHTKSLNLP